MDNCNAHNAGEGGSMKYDFDSPVERKDTASMKWDTYDHDILPMWVADSDFRSPPEIVEAIEDIARRGIFGYPLPDGSFENACIHWQNSRFGWKPASSQVSWCPGIGTAISLCVNAFTKPGDGVAMLCPIYPPFMRLCELNGREVRPSVLELRNGRYEINFAGLEQILQKPDTSLFLLCNPHNPTGRIFEKDELERMGELCLKYGVTIFSDEIHEDITFGGKHIPFPVLSAKMAAISLVGVNASKTFNVADLRAGAIISENPILLDAIVEQRNRFKLGPCSLGLAGVTSAWQKGASYADQLVAYIKANLEYAVNRINSSCPGISAYMPEATYLLWLDCSGLGMDNRELMDFFLHDAKVALNNGADFGPGGEGFMRLNAACPRKILSEGLDRISSAILKRKTA